MNIVDKVLSLYAAGVSKAEIGRLIKQEFSLDISDNAARKRVDRIVEKHKGLSDKCDEAGLPVGQVKSYWYKDKNYSVQVSVPSPDIMSVDDLGDRLSEIVSKHRPNYEFSPVEDKQDSCLLVIDPADLHIGKLALSEETGENYDDELAVARLTSGVLNIVKGCHYDIDQVLFVAGNDILHVDGPFNSTSAGTRQDVSSMWWKSFEYAQLAYVRIIEYLRNLAPVHFVHNPSNHDYVNGYLLAKVTESWFRDCEGITFDISMRHRKYFRYDNNLIGTTHGDGAKEDKLPLLMAVEASGDWSECDHKYIYTHHIHHKTAKDYPGVTIESVRSASSADSWHHKKGHQHAPKAIEGFVHDKQKGQILRITHKFYETDK